MEFPPPVMSSTSLSASHHLWRLEDWLSFYERTCSQDADTVIRLQFGPVPVNSDQLQPLPSFPLDETSGAQFLEVKAQPDGAPQFSPPKLALFIDAKEATPPGDGSASGEEEQHICERCGNISKRLQEFERHAREVHDTPGQCPFCPFKWKRAYKIKEHLIKVHHKEFVPMVLKGIHILRGQKVIKFVETIEFLRNFKPPETYETSPPFLIYGGYFFGSMGVVPGEGGDERGMEEMTEVLEDSM